MKKKVIGVVSALVLVVVMAVGLVACNPYKWSAIGGGDSSAEVESNGGYAVKQGKYLYYINGYDGTGGSGNEWGAPVKQSIVRSELDEDGNVVNSTTKVVVPKIIYNSSAKGGFAIYDEWIYYATPNNDRDKNGTASTTDTDFMRTKINGSITQRLGKIDSRDSEYLFTKSRIWYYKSSTLSYIDFSGMKTDKNIDNASGAKNGEFATNVSSVAWDMNSERIYYTQDVTGANSYKNYNELYSVKIDGSGKRLIATEDTFVTEKDEDDKKIPEAQPQNVFKYNLRGIYVEKPADDQITETIYYTKTHHIEDDETDGLFCANVTLADSATAIVESEIKIEESGATTLIPLGYQEGAIVNVNSGYYWFKPGEEAVEVFNASKNIALVDQEEGIVYFTDTSTASSLQKISYKEKNATASIVISEGIKVDWLKLDFIDDDFYFFATDDSNYMHTINVKTFDKTAEDEDGNLIGSTYIGFERDEESEEE
ncbi:MAG: hypothetical protein NC037_02605 [Bacteroides sp.]|nr:hypothetical protein [Bacillota bacterium]MCM1393418.1 hypothetical protein [[Eubacterium] siraeum]MCM1455404.1 hypothetical protein [Bacteroides sp.]